MDAIFTAAAVEATEYRRLFRSGIPVYLSADFCEINRSKVDALEYLFLQKGNSPRFMLPVGIRNGEALCPFSAPFSYPAMVKKGQTMEDYDLALAALDSYARDRGWRSLRFTLPPFFYDADVLSAWANAFFRAGFSCETLDLNYSLDLKSLDLAHYESGLAPNTRRNLRIAGGSDLSFLRCETEAEVRAAYAVIAENRAAKGYPLRMTLDQVLATLKIVPHDLFLVRRSGEDIAAAMVYHVRDQIAQVIYCGDRPGFGEYKPVNYLSYQLLCYYSARGFSWLDIGPSTENSVPNYGLCSFKESIGCTRAPKLTLCKRYGG